MNLLYFMGIAIGLHYREMVSIKKLYFGVPYDVKGEKVLVNVGAVIGDREWVLYDLGAEYSYVYESVRKRKKTNA